MRRSAGTRSSSACIRDLGQIVTNLSLLSATFHVARKCMTGSVGDQKLQNQDNKELVIFVATAIDARFPHLASLTNCRQNVLCWDLDVIFFYPL